MNREIKFRAWDKRKKKMRLDFAIGSSGETLETGHGCDEGCLGVEDVSDDWIASGGGNENVWNVMQFTGLLDKNGKEIYEGDIVGEKWIQKTIDKEGEHFTGRIADKYPVEYSGCGFTPFAYSHFGDEGIDESNVEVIGNVWENPELLDIKLKK